jgi:hypothetical protein
LSFFVLRLPLIHIINPTLVGMKRGLFMSYMNTHAAFAPAGGIQELSFDEVRFVSGSVGVPGGAIGGVVGGIFGGYNYIAGHAGNGKGTGATFGGALAAIGSGMVGGAIAGATGTWTGAIAGAAVGVAGAYASGTLDSRKANVRKK